jgi:hypothetical protein
MPQPVPSTPPKPNGPNRTLHYMGLAVLTIALFVGVAAIL